MKGKIKPAAPPLAVFVNITQRIPTSVLQPLVDECRKKPLAHTCPAERK